MNVGGGGGGGADIQICNILNLKVVLLPVKMSSFDHTKVWRPKLW